MEPTHRATNNPGSLDETTRWKVVVGEHVPDDTPVDWLQAVLAHQRPLPDDIHGVD